jgi:hypothetical protein
MLRTHFYVFLLLPLVIHAQLTQHLKLRPASDEEVCDLQCKLDNPVCYGSNSLCGTTELPKLIEERSHALENLPASEADESLITVPYTPQSTSPLVTTAIAASGTIVYPNTAFASATASIIPTLVSQSFVLSTYTSISTVVELTTILLTPSSTILSPAPSTSTTSPNASGQTATVFTQAPPSSTVSHGGVGRVVRGEKIYALGLMIAVGILM